MGSVRRRQRSQAQLATSRALDADVERTLQGEESPYGDKASFIPSDLLTDETIRRCHAEGSNVVVVDERGNERLLPVPV